MSQVGLFAPRTDDRVVTDPTGAGVVLHRPEGSFIVRGRSAAGWVAAPTDAAGKATGAPVVLLPLDEPFMARFLRFLVKARPAVDRGGSVG